MIIENEVQMREFGRRLGKALKGGELLELVGDVGAGKTTLTKAIAEGLGIRETVQSPTFTINRIYQSPRGIRLVHYDFYRLSDAGLMAHELQEELADSQTVVVIEWADVVENVLPQDRLRITITPRDEMSRDVVCAAGGEAARALQEAAC